MRKESQPIFLGVSEEIQEEIVMDNTEEKNGASVQDSAADEFRELARKLRVDPSPTIGLTEILETVYEKPPALIEGFLFNGIYILAGAPKTGKSFLMEQIA